MKQILDRATQGCSNFEGQHGRRDVNAVFNGVYALARHFGTLGQFLLSQARGLSQLFQIVAQLFVVFTHALLFFKFFNGTGDFFASVREEITGNHHTRADGANQQTNTLEKSSKYNHAK